MNLKNQRRELITKLRATDNLKEQDEIKNQIDILEEKMCIELSTDGQL